MNEPHSPTQPTTTDGADPAAHFRRDPAWWSWFVQELKHEPTHALTVAYLSISALGVWSSFWFFRSFGISVLDYMDPSDYLTAGLRDPSYFLTVLVAYLFSMAITWSQRFYLRDPEGYTAWRERHRWAAFYLKEDPTRVRWMDALGWKGFTPVGGLLFGVVAVTLSWTWSLAAAKAERIKAGGGHPVRLTIVHTHEPQPGTARMLGTIGDFVFLYWPASKRAEAVSVESASRLQSLTLQEASKVASETVSQPHAAQSNIVPASDKAASPGNAGH